MGLAASLDFVFGGLAKNHLGPVFGWIVLAGSVLLGVGAWRARADSPPPEKPADWWTLSSLFLFAPALVLVLHQQKSEIVVGALAPGAIGLVLALWASWYRRRSSPWPAGLFVAVVCGAAGWFFTARQFAPAYDAAFAHDARKVNALADYVYSTSRAAGLAHPRIAVDQVTDCLDAQIMRVICYERKKVWAPFGMTLPTGIWKEKEEVLFTRLAESDFVFITEEGASGTWPYDEQMTALRPRTKAWCDQHLRLVERFPLFGKHMALYQRREIPLLHNSSKK